MKDQPQTEYPLHSLIVERWSPYNYSDRPVPDHDLRAVFEAAAWAASSFNEQPWRYLVAAKSSPADFQRILDCLVPANQAWAKNAPVLALGVVKKTFSRNGNPNPVAEHDLGAASATLTFEASARGLHVHQMAGLDPDKAHEICNIPRDDWRVVTALAIGYHDRDAPEELRARDEGPRTRKPLSSYLFSADWDKPGPAA